MTELSRAIKRRKVLSLRIEELIDEAAAEALGMPPEIVVQEILNALKDFRPLDENVAADTYWSLAEMIEPHVAREGSNPEGGLPASVFESVQMLLEYWVSQGCPEL